MPPIWTKIIATPAMTERFAGTVPMPPASTAAMRELFRRLEAEGGGFVHHADLPLAERWMLEAGRLASEAEELRADAAGIADQNELTVKLWNAIGNTYRALNIPWVIDPIARTLFLRCTLWRESASVDGGNATALCDVGSWRDRAAPLGAYDSPELGRCLHLVHRIIMEPNGTVGAPAIYNGQGTGAYWGDGVHHGRQIWGWKSYAWHYDCKRRMGAGDCQAWVSEFFTPLHWWYLLGRDITRSLIERGALRVIFESLRACVLLNLKAAAEARVLAAAAGEPVAAAVAPLVGLGELQLAEGIAAYTDNNEAQVRERLAAIGGGVSAVAGPVAGVIALVAGGTMGAATAAAAAAATGVGLIFSIVIGIGLALSFALPPAFARNVDPFGRDRPVYERPRISGDLRTPPTHTVPDPPTPPDRRPFERSMWRADGASTMGPENTPATPGGGKAGGGKVTPGGKVVAPGDAPPPSEKEPPPPDAPPPADTPPASPPPAEPSSMAPLALAAALVVGVAYAASRRR